MLVAGLLWVAAIGWPPAAAPRCDRPRSATARWPGLPVVTCTNRAGEDLLRLRGHRSACPIWPAGLDREARFESVTDADPTDGARISGASRLLFGLRLDLNHDTATSFEALPGVGSSRAETIRRSRVERPFRSVDDLRGLPGFGRRIRSAIARCVEVTPVAGR